MQKPLFFIFGFVLMLHVSAQNLVVNPGAENSPAGTGWTIVNSGTTACSSAPTNTYNNWTMIPDGSVNHPFDHTTGAAGGMVFFAGCNPFSFPGFTRFELYQDIDVSAYATNINLGTAPFTFSGYMQTPVSIQTDRGRFIVEYLDGSNAVLGSSYTSSWQSNATGSGTGWNSYNNTSMAPIGTIKVRIRLQAELQINQFEINVYFDDISLTTPSIVPVKLISFTGNESAGSVNLNWQVADELNFLNYILEQSTNAVNYKAIATIAGGNTRYSYADKISSYHSSKYFYRLKMTDTNGKFSYSNVLPIILKEESSITLSPNPAKSFVTVSGLDQQGTITINSSGATVFNTKTNTRAPKINISQLSSGLYIVRFSDGKNISYHKLVVQNQ